MIRITVYTGPSSTDPREPGVSVRECEDRDVTEELRQIGLEWKTADYMTQRQVVITLDPMVEQDLAAIKAAVIGAVDRLESTGLL